jgi:hypothetical protein
MKSTTASIGFRLSAATARDLAIAAKREGLTPGLYARRLVVNALTQEDETAKAAEVEELRNEIQLLRRDLARSVVALLSDAGKAEVEEANAWVKSNLSGGSS